MYPGGVDQLATQRSPSDLPVRRALKGHTDGIAAILPSAQGWILTAGSDGSVLEWQEAILTHPETEGLRKHDEFEYRTGFSRTAKSQGPHGNRCKPRRESDSH